MATGTHTNDVQAIEAIIARQFAILCWTPGTSADWAGFAADFFPEALLYPAAHPAKRHSVEAFIEWMKPLKGTKLCSFAGAVLGNQIRVLGNVAVALAACEMTENDADVQRSVEILLLIRNAGAWQIVAQAWDTERPSQPIPMRLLGRAAGE
jgi:hypothetical protein